MRQGEGPSAKKMRRTIESSGGQRAKAEGTVSEKSQPVWHSTATSNFLHRGSSFRDAGTEKVGTQKSALSDSGIDYGLPRRATIVDSRSPAKITEPSGHAIFSTILQKHGFFLLPEGNNTQNDFLLFRTILIEWANKAESEASGDLQMFIQDMKRYLGAKENVVTAMSPTECSQQLYPATILHCLLGVLPLQKQFFTVLFATLAEAAYTVRDLEDAAFFSLLLKQLKWLPYLNEEEKLIDDLLDIFERATPKAQLEMMRLLPDIIPESQHRKIGDKLQKLLEDFSPLCSSIMDCFSMINVPDSYIVKVRGTAVENMLVADQKDIPAYLGFLLGVEEPSLLSEIIGDLRDKLIFRKRMEVNEEYKSNMGAMIEKVKFRMSVNSLLIPAWVKQVKDEISLDIADFKMWDFVMLNIFITSDRLAEVPLKILFLSEDRTLKVLDDVLECLPMVVDHDCVFGGIVKFCQKFFWTTATKFYSVASKVLAKLFPVVSDPRAREIVKIFTCTLAHDNKVCRQHLLHGLTVISKKDCAKLLRFKNLIMAIMDLVIDFEPSQIRSFIRILATLAYIPANRESERFETEFCILLQKQLSQPHEKIKSVGVIGAVAAIDQLAKRPDTEVKLQELVELVWKTVEHGGYSSWVFLDEMSDVIKERDLPGTVTSSLRNLLGEKFKERWVVEEPHVSTGRWGDCGIRVKPAMNANETMTDVEHLCIVFDTIPVGFWPAALPAHTKFLCTLESRLFNGDLQEVDLIVGCPLLLPEFKYYTGLMTSSLTVEKKNALGRYLLVAINYVRELISAFYPYREQAARIKVFLRLDHLVALQKMLISFISSWDNSFTSLPFAYALEKNVGALTFVQASKKKVKCKKTDKTVPSTPFFDDSSDSDGGNVGNKTVRPRKNKATSRGFESTDTKDYIDEIDPAGIRPLIRNFDGSVFRLLKYPLIMSPPNIDHIALLKVLEIEQESYMNEMNQVSILSPDMLILLLSDLNQQIEAERSNPSTSVSGVQEGFFKEIFQCLCEHLDVLHTSCLTDFNSWSLLKKRQVESCYRLLYTTIRNYLEGEHKGEQSQKFASALKIMTEHAGRPSSKALDEGAVAQYLIGYPDFINSPQTAAEQLKVMKVVYDLADSKQEIGKKIDELAKEYLQRWWKIPSSVIPVILNIWFTSSERPINITVKSPYNGSQGRVEIWRFHCILALSRSIIPDAADKAIPDSSEYKACTAVNFQTWCRTIMEALSQHVSKRMKTMSDLNVALAEWNEAIEVLKLLVLVIQQTRQPKIITPLLKNVRTFLEAFTTHGIKLLPLLWRTDANKARSLLHHLQNPTRKIQYICQHSKLEKNTLLIRYVPGVRRALETLVFKVREVLTVHGTPNAFWMGSLKLRNFDGEKFNSQITEVSDSDETEESESEETSANEGNLFDMPPHELNDNDD